MDDLGAPDAILGGDAFNRDMEIERKRVARKAIGAAEEGAFDQRSEWLVEPDYRAALAELRSQVRYALDDYYNQGGSGDWAAKDLAKKLKELISD